MATNKVSSHLKGNKEKAMGYDWPHAPETDIQHYTNGPTM